MPEYIAIDGCQAFDTWDQHPANPDELEATLARRAFKFFREDFPEFYFVEKNVKILLDVLNWYQVPCTRKNLGIVYAHLLPQKPFEPRHPEVTYTPVRDPYVSIKRVGSNQTLVLRYDTGNAAQRQLAGEGNPAELEQLTEIAASRIVEDTLNYREAGANPGQPISKQFRQKYLDSLRDHSVEGRNNRIAAQNATMGVHPKLFYAAQNAVLSEHEGIKVNSITFKNLVRQKLIEQGHLSE